MKKLFRKAVSVLGSVALVGATISTAAAATYPAPFDGGDYAVVYGGALDQDAANTIASGLPTLGGSATTVTGGDSHTFEKTSDKFNLGDVMTDFDLTLDDDDLPNFLMEGIAEDSDREEYDFTQTLTVKGTQVKWFSDTNYMDGDEPAIGIFYDSTDSTDEQIIDYTIEFEDGGLPNASIEGVDLPLMGQLYYVLDVDADAAEITLLDSSQTTLVSEGSSVTVNVGGEDYKVEALVEDTWVQFTVNGETTDKLYAPEDNNGAVDYYTLDDDAVIALKENLYTSKDTGVSKAEFTLGAGELLLKDDDEVEMSEDPVRGVVSQVQFDGSSGELTEITLEWTADEDVFLTADNPEVVMPGFGALKIVYGGIEFPDAEELMLSSGTELTLDAEVAEGSLGIPLMWFDDATGALNNSMGSEGDPMIIQADLSAGVNLSEGESFIVSYINSGEEYATYVYELSSVTDRDGTNEIVLKSLVTGGSDITLDHADPEDANDMTFNVTESLDNDYAVINVTPQISGPVVSGNVIYTVMGTQLTIPQTSDLGGAGYNTSATMTIREVDEDQKANQSDMGLLTLTVAVENGDNEESIHVSGVTGYDAKEETSDGSDVDRGYIYSEVASAYELDTSGDVNDFTFFNHGEEVMVTVQVASGTATVTSDSGQKVFMDSESGYSGKNIVVVGGSCVNSVAASLYDGAHCGDAWVGATGVGPGKFLIETFDYSGKVATVVAGYEKDDTAKAAAYLNNDAKAVTTDVGVKYVGETATEHAVIVP